MTQRELERELAVRTGESLTTIRCRGFSLVEPPDLKPLIVDWDQLAAERVRMLPERRCAAAAA